MLFQTSKQSGKLLDNREIAGEFCGGFEDKTEIKREGIAGVVFACNVDGM